MDHYDKKAFDEKDHAYAWAMAWFKLRYVIVEREDLFEFKKGLRDRNKHLHDLSDDLLWPLYEKYIMPYPDLKSNETSYYDPLLSFNDKYLSKKPEYLKLVELDTDSESDILDYVNANGLLGILLHRLKFISINHPADEISSESGFISSNSKKENSDEDSHYSLESALLYFENEEDATAEMDEIQLSTFGNFGLWFICHNATNVTPLSQEDVNNTFFPFKADPYELVDMSDSNNMLKLTAKIAKLDRHIPMNDWRYLYAEPLELFIREVNSFKATYKKAVELQDAIKEGQDIQLKHLSISDDFKINLMNVNPTPKVQSEKDFLSFGWDIRSLLSAYYLMLYLNINHRGKARYCGFRRCRRPFIAERDDNIYCSFTCKEAGKKDRQRHPEIYKKI